MLFVVVLLAVGACGDDDGSPTVAETTAVPTTAVETTVAADPTAEITAVYEAFFDGTNTDMASKVDPKIIEGVVASLPLRRIGESKEIASVVLFLASDLASYVSGARVECHGGGEPPVFLSALEGQS